MKIAAVQMTATLGEVGKNLQSTRHLATSALQQGAQMVILPEFFPSAMGFHPRMNTAARPLDGEPASLLLELARTHDGVIGGSFIATRKGGTFNTFILAFPDGTLYTHDKDQPTTWENCYYQGGADDGILSTPPWQHRRCPLLGICTRTNRPAAGQSVCPLTHLLYYRIIRLLNSIFIRQNRQCGRCGHHEP
ncbi:MAG: carbon-nitrogen hydrolase family protein [Thermodesulfobacteriota bacterium]|nr:carbon-nitrogen hydrolase family protein [Thermodesulfobacteriota bacterium]